MYFNTSLKTTIQRPWFIAFLLFSVFLAVNGYKYGWDDQHLEIPLLKHLIDPSLYAGDYYVESTTANFSSYFYPILAKLISVEQIPTAYFILYLISRYFLFYFTYKLWLHISKDRFKAVCCTLTFILISRVHEFLYRTFSHQEFALAIIFAGIYFFFKQRYVLAAFTLGVAANLHALYSLFPMFYMGLYLLWNIRRHGFKTLIASCGTFVLAASPFILWIMTRRLASGAGEAHGLYDNWLQLFYIACPQNFPFTDLPIEKLTYSFDVFMVKTQFYLFLTALLALNFFFNETFRKNREALAFSAGAVILIAACFIFAYAYPVRFIIDLNLVRNTQYLLFLLMGFTTILCIDVIEAKRPLTAFGFLVAFVLIKYGHLVGAAAVAIMLLLLIADKAGRDPSNAMYRRPILVISAIVAAPLLFYIYRLFGQIQFQLFTALTAVLIFIAALINYFLLTFIKGTKKRPIRRAFIIVPLLIFFSQYLYYHYQKIQEEKYSEGSFWSLQRSWEDMQRFAKHYTPKDAIILVPYNMEMCGFRIQAEREIVASYRDCGIIGFDYRTAVEWQKRIKDIEPFKVVMRENPQKAVEKAIMKYKANYIVFMRYAYPDDSSILQKIYTNRDFVLFEVLPNQHYLSGSF